MNAIHHSENIYIFKFTVSTKILGSTAVFNTYNNRTFFLSTITISNQIKSNQITFIVTSPQHKCLGEWNSYERAPDSAEKQQTIYLWTDSAKKTTDNLHMDRQCKKTTNNLHMDRQCKKTALEHLQCSRQCKKTQQQQFTYGQTVQKNNSNLQFTISDFTSFFIYKAHLKTTHGWPKCCTAQ